MKRFKLKYDVILFALLMVFLCASMVQKYNKVFSMKELVGVFEPAPQPELSWQSYRNTQWQQRLEAYAGEHFGFREPVIRIYNQYLWSAFRKTYCHYIEPGKQNFLYYKSAVNDYYGNELLGHFKSNEEALWYAETELGRMNQLRQVLKGYGIEFLAFIAPDKPEVYPEFLPRKDADTTTLNMAEYYDRRMTELGFPHINMTNWFVAMRDTVSFPLFLKTDSHWTYASVYGFDSLFRFMNTLEGPDFPRLHIGPPEAYESDKMQGDESVLNLLFRIRGDRVRYKSEITVEADSAQRKPRVLFVGDSFIWSMSDFLPIRELMDHVEVWFYNSTAFVGFDFAPSKVKEINTLRHILKADYVVFYAAGHQWREASFGFTKETLKLFENLSDADALRYLKINEIEGDKEWLLALKAYASQQEMSLEEVLGLEANNVLENKALIREGISTDTASLIQIKKNELRRQWKLNPNQMKVLAKKAMENNLSVEEMMERDIQWVINYQLENGELFNNK